MGKKQLPLWSGHLPHRVIRKHIHKVIVDYMSIKETIRRSSKVSGQSPQFLTWNKGFHSVWFLLISLTSPEPQHFAPLAPELPWFFQAIFCMPAGSGMASHGNLLLGRIQPFPPCLSNLYFFIKNWVSAPPRTFQRCPSMLRVSGLTQQHGGERKCCKLHSAQSQS